jgi:uncharacterized protein
LSHELTFTDYAVIPAETQRRVDDDGILHARGVVARAGVQLYRARELGLSDRAPDSIVRVYRSPAALAAAAKSFEDKAITLGHPSPAKYPQGVTADNWAELAHGHMNHVEVEGPLMYADLHVGRKTTVNDVQSKPAELSNSYRAILEMTPGTSPDGEAFDGTQESMRGNHCAIIIRNADSNTRARGGEVCRVLDHTQEDGETQMSKRIVILMDAAGKPSGHDLEEPMATLAEKLESERLRLTQQIADSTTAAKAATDKLIADHAAELAKLKEQVVTPAKLHELVADRAAVLNDCASLCPSVKPTNEMQTDAIRRAMLTDLVGRSETAKRISDAIIVGGLKDDTSPESIRAALDAAKVTVEKSIADGEELDTKTANGLCPRKPVGEDKPTNDSTTESALVGRAAYVRNLTRPEVKGKK